MNKSSLVSSLPISMPSVRFKMNLSLKFLLAFALTIIFSLLITCVYLLNVYTSEVYTVSKYGKMMNQLSQENKFLEINLTKADSLQNMGNYVQNFERAGKIEYIRVLETTALAK